MKKTLVRDPYTQAPSHTRKLVLHRQTVHVLSEDDLRRVAGGGAGPAPMGTTSRFC